MREREREQGRDGAEQRGLKGEERGRSVRVGLRTPPRLLLFSDWPSLLPSPLLRRWGSPVSRHVTKVKESR